MTQYVVIITDDNTDEVTLMAGVETPEQLTPFSVGLSPTDQDEAAHIQETLETEGAYGIRDNEGRDLTVGFYKQCNTLEPEPDAGGPDLKRLFGVSNYRLLARVIRQSKVEYMGDKGKEAVAEKQRRTTARNMAEALARIDRGFNTHQFLEDCEVDY